MRQPDVSLEMVYEDEPFLGRTDHVAGHGFDAVEFATGFDTDLNAARNRVDHDERGQRERVE